MLGSVSIELRCFDQLEGESVAVGDSVVYSACITDTGAYEDLHDRNRADCFHDTTRGAVVALPDARHSAHYRWQTQPNGTGAANERREARSYGPVGQLDRHRRSETR